MKLKSIIISLVFIILFSDYAQAQDHSVARRWNERVLDAIRNDFARPTVHARNLFHTSAAMYDAWAAYGDREETIFLGQNFQGWETEFEGIDTTNMDIEAAREKAISFAAYRIIQHRFLKSPALFLVQFQIDTLFNNLGYDINNLSVDYQSGDPAALGNYIAQSIINFGQQDGSNEQMDYQNTYYTSVNDPMIVRFPGNPDITDPNRWQPLTLQIFIDQSGNIIPGNTPDFLSPEWGKVVPFALNQEDLIINQDDNGNEYWVYHDPGKPPYISTGNAVEQYQYQWGNSLVAIWSSHLDPADGVMQEISPAVLGNVDQLPQSFSGHQDFYNLIEGGSTRSKGHLVNPHTNLPYESNMVLRGDYGRVLAEFWADGPDSETPPGHWFTLLNYISDRPEIEKKYKGIGTVLSDLEWDVKSYLLLGGTMHDCAVSAWGIKGWYDYIRPVSAIRYMAAKGQSSNPNLPFYHADGLPLIPGYIAVVSATDPLAGETSEHVGKIKLNCWKGPDFINDPDIDVAGVGWILAENWLPYQRPSFVTPNFAGYVSGHSTFSRAAAEVLTKLTGDEFFPGGMGAFIAEKNEFLVFEDGPSEEVVLQWATYRDASDQTSLSRIWGGIHPPADDIPGRIIGIEIAEDAFHKADGLFNALPSANEELELFESSFSLYPNVANENQTIQIEWDTQKAEINEIRVYNLAGYLQKVQKDFGAGTAIISTQGLSQGSHIVTLRTSKGAVSKKLMVLD